MPVTIAAEENGPNSVVTGGGRIVWSNEDTSEHNGKIRAWSVSGIETLATNQGRPADLATDGDYVYWAAPLDGTVMRASLTGGSPQAIASGERGPSSVRRSGDVLYWVSYTSPDPMDSARSIRSMPAAGGAVTNVYDLGVNVGDNIGVALDSTSFYWAEFETGQIMRLAKPL
jgi:hypothetical protein